MKKVLAVSRLVFSRGYFEKKFGTRAFITCLRDYGVNQIDGDWEKRVAKTFSDIKCDPRNHNEKWLLYLRLAEVFSGRSEFFRAQVKDIAELAGAFLNWVRTKDFKTLADINKALKCERMAVRVGVRDMETRLPSVPIFVCFLHRLFQIMAEQSDYRMGRFLWKQVSDVRLGKQPCPLSDNEFFLAGHANGLLCLVIAAGLAYGSEYASYFLIAWATQVMFSLLSFLVSAFSPQPSTEAFLYQHQGKIQWVMGLVLNSLFSSRLIPATGGYMAGTAALTLVRSGVLAYYKREEKIPSQAKLGMAIANGAIYSVAYRGGVAGAEFLGASLGDLSQTLHAYYILGVPPWGNVRQSYRHLSETLHPDKGGDPKNWETLTAAYNFLMRGSPSI